MKKRIITGAAAALTAAVSLGACGMYGPPPQQNVYGPPEYFESETETEMTTTELTSSDTYDPVDSEIECVYGPPEWFGIEETTSEDTTAPASETSVAETTTEEVTTSTTAAVTSPPLAITAGRTKKSVEETTTAETTVKTKKTTTTTATFDPEENEPEDVYGPPEWFGDADYDRYDADDDFAPEANDPVDVYGPPEWFE